MKVIGLHIFPVRSCLGMRPEKVSVTKTGFRLDREFAVVSPEGALLTQESSPKLARVKVTVVPHSDRIALNYDSEKQSLMVDPQDHSGIVRIEDWNVGGFNLGARATRWFKQHLGVEAKLVKLNKPELNKASNAGSAYINAVAPVLVTQKSLDALNEVLAIKDIIPEQFRAGVVIDGEEPFAENTWGEIRIGSVVYKVIGPADLPSSVAINLNTRWFDADILKTVREGCQQISGNPTFGVRLAPLVESDEGIKLEDPVVASIRRNPELQRAA